MDDLWRPLIHGSLKINCGVRVDKRKRQIGYGIIVRNEEGRVLWCSAQGCEVNYDLDSAKAMAIYKGITAGRDKGLVNYVVESDAETVIKQIGKGDLLETSYTGIMVAIQNLMADVRNVSFHHVSTKANKVALALAKEALSIHNMVGWKEDAPLCITKMVEVEQRP
ncbi:hypothetical protein LWI29_017405 [Acer saccharum]|uniref:RNase H type-1 domain-containing protein n=1 Tax=Acer saccharum TaxID=4024 RepID=A0AA39SLU9_ACESA|nr:hypothetical protein LWI29_017405 [Acer saccharum]